MNFFKINSKRQKKAQKRRAFLCFFLKTNDKGRGGRRRADGDIRPYARKHKWIRRGRSQTGPPIIIHVCLLLS